MSYQVLARKWRPKSFREMVGQEHVLQALINALDHDRLHHAYLFTGTRGVGKTTIARIFAKCLNCEQGVSSEPCGECSSCQEIAEGRSVDLLEVDAASRTKVEDTRELLENVQYAPTRSRYKIYLIDEVHMLSNSSFNALLKTLEEPPPHVKFLLATTDPQKLLPTVLSRCLQFNLKNMPPEQIVGHLRTVLEQEMVGFEEPALYLLARAAAGSMRDALSLADQAIAYGSGKLSEVEVRAMLGTVDLAFVYEILEGVVAGEPQRLLDVVERLSEHAPDYEGSVDELISLLHRVTVAQLVPEAVDNSWGDAERVAALAGSMSAEDAQLFYQIALHGKRDMAYVPDPRGGLEMTLLRMIAFRPAAVIDENLTAEDIEPVKRPAIPAASEVGQDSVKKPPEPAVRCRVQAAPEPACEDGAVVDAVVDRGGALEQAISNAGTAVLAPERWPQLLEQLGLLGMVYNIASNCELVAVDGDSLSFVLDEGNASLFNEGHSDRIRLALQNYLHRPLSVWIEVGTPPGEPPAMQHARAARERQAEAVAEIERDERLQQLLARFDGELDPGSIAPMDS